MPTSKNRRLPQWQFPQVVVNNYALRLNRIIDMWEETFFQVFTPGRMQMIAEERDSDLRLDAFSAAIQTFLNEYKENMSRRFPSELYASLSSDIAGQTEIYNNKQFQKVVRSAIGIDIYKEEPYLRPLSESFINTNVSLIKNMEDKYRNSLEIIVQNGYASGTRAAEIAKDIKGVKNTNKNHAKFIARDQIAKLNGRLQKTRQTNIGIDKYTWRTVLDDRVRYEHRIQDGNVYSWNKPPKMTGHPGEDYQCRCYAEPIFDEELENILLGRV